MRYHPESTFDIDVVSDVVCPWCFVGKRQLEAALQRRRELRVTVKWRPFLLDPTVPAGGLSSADYIRKKFGSGGYFEAMRRNLERIGSKLGISFAFDRMTIRPNSTDAHRLIAWADEVGAQDAVVEELFTRYFERAEDIGDPDILLDVARNASLDVDDIAKRLSSAEGRDEVFDQHHRAASSGVTGVPCFLVGGVFVISGAQSVEVFLNVLDKAEEVRRELTERPDGSSDTS